MKKKIIVIGGGTGTSVVLSGLKQYPDQCSLTAVVVVSDSGGSTGRLRDEFGFIPVGDVRQCLAALAHGKNQQQIRELLLYRFCQGEGLAGHNLGNLILTALEDLYPDPSEAIAAAGKIFRIKGRILPVTDQLVQLKITYQNGQVNLGEHTLDDPQFGGQKIVQIELEPIAKINPQAAQAIQEADLVILGPGDLYASLLANSLVSGFTQALASSKAKFVYISNLMTHYAQTHDMSARDHLQEVISYCQRQPDIVLVNSAPIPQEILNYYQQLKEFPVKDDLTASVAEQIIRADLISKIKVQKQPGDALPRSVLRHDQTKLAQLLLGL